jgi:hypothetical protein
MISYIELQGSTPLVCISLLVCVDTLQTGYSLVQGPSSAVCPGAPGLTALYTRAPMLPHVPRLWTLPLHSGGVRCRHASRGFGPRLTLGRALKPPRIPSPRSRGGEGGLCHRYMSSSYSIGPQIKKYQDIMGEQQGSHVIEVCPRDIEPPARRAGKRVIMTCNASRPRATVLHYSATLLS